MRKLSGKIKEKRKQEAGEEKESRKGRQVILASPFYALYWLLLLLLPEFLLRCPPFSGAPSLALPTAKIENDFHFYIDNEGKTC